MDRVQMVRRGGSRVLAAIGLIVALGGTASAQWRWGPSPFAEERIAPWSVVSSLSRGGYRDITRPRFDGGAYVVEASSPWGNRVRLVIDAYDGTIVSRRRLDAALLPPRDVGPRSRDDAPRIYGYRGEPLPEMEDWDRPAAPERAQPPAKKKTARAEPPAAKKPAAPLPTAKPDAAKPAGPAAVPLAPSVVESPKPAEPEKPVAARPEPVAPAPEPVSPPAPTEAPKAEAPAAAPRNVRVIGGVTPVPAAPSEEAPRPEPKTDTPMPPPVD